MLPQQHQPAFAAPLPLSLSPALPTARASPLATACAASPSPPPRRRRAAAIGLAGLAAAAALALPPREAAAAAPAARGSAQTAAAAAAAAGRGWKGARRTRGGAAVRIVASGAGVGAGGFKVAAGAALVASAAATLVCHPIDTIKTMKQAEGMEGVGVEESSGDGEGGGSGLSFARLYRGVGSNVMKEAPNAAVYLGCYEMFKTWLLACGGMFTAAPLLTFCLAGMLGDAVGSVIRVPAEVVNKRLQLNLSPTAGHAARVSFLTRTGLQTTLESWKAVALRDVPYGGLQIALYEAFRGLILTTLAVSGLLPDVAAGAAAGLIAAVLTTPADVLVTRLAAQNPQCYLETRRFMSPVATARRVVEEGGFQGLWSGAAARGLYYAPLIGVFFACYEVAKKAILYPAATAAVLSNGIGGMATFVLAAGVWLLRKGVMRRGVRMAHVGLWGMLALLRKVKRQGEGPITE